MKLHCAILFFVISVYGSAQSLIINEVCPVNSELLEDNHHENSDWIELKNIGATTIQLSDYSLSIKNSNTTPWDLPNRQLKSGEIYLIYASKFNEFKNDTTHTDFSMDRFDDELKLVRNGVVEDKVAWTELYADMSIGKGTNNSLKYFDSPTPGLENTTTEYIGICSPPSFSKSSRFFEGSLNLTLTGAHPIYYSLQLDSPTVNSLKYSLPFNSDSTFVISARCFETNYIPSKIIYQTFIKGASPGFPTVFFHSDPNNLYSEDYGIFEFGKNADPLFPYYGANFWTTKEFRGYIDIVSVNNNQIFSGNIGFKPHGGTSARNKSQKPLRLIFREDYGEKRVKAKLFSGKPANKFKRLVLRNSGGDFNKTNFRDAILHQIMLEDELNLELTGYTPMRAYVNGENWGIYNLREKVGKQYLETNFDVHRDSVNLIEGSYEIIEGDSIDHFNVVEFSSNNDLSISSNYKYVTDRVDIENLVDYFSSEIILANGDWPNNNLKFWKPTTGGKWRYIFFDLDASLANYSFFAADYNMWSRFFLKNSLINQHVILFKELLKNEEFSRYFINRYADLTNTTFSVERFDQELESVRNHLFPQMKYHFEKWGNTYEKWEDEIDVMSPWIEERADHHRKHLQDSLHTGDPYKLIFDVFPPDAGTVDLNTIKLNAFPWSGYYFNKNSIDITINENDGFKFKHWLIHSSEQKYISKTLDIDFDTDDQITAIFQSNEPIDNTLKIYPSPAKSTASVSLNFLQSKKSNLIISVFNTSGKMVYEIEEEGSLPGNKSFEISLNDFSVGIYLVRVIGDDFVLTNKLTVE